MLRRYLIGLFSLTLFISGGLFAFLMLEENQDLSSRASGWLAGVAPLEVPKYDDGERDLFGGEEIGGKRIKINYQVSFWQEVDEGLLVSGDRKTTVRLVEGNLSTGEILKQYFANDKQVRAMGRLEGVNSRESFVYSFYGQEAVVDVWNLLDGRAKVVAVMATEKDRGLVENLLSKVELADGRVEGAVTELLDNEVRVVTLSRPSVVMIATNYCGEVIVPKREGLISSGGKNYPFCLMTSGSGFFVDSRGFIATNGHVVKIDRSEAFEYGVNSGLLDGFIRDILTDVVRANQGVEVGSAEMEKAVVEMHKNKEDLYRLLANFETMSSDGLFQLDQGDYKYLVQLGKTPIKFSGENKIGRDEGVVEAKFVDANYGSYDEKKGFDGSDVALLKVEGEVIYPALPLGDSDDLVSGASLQVIGFPSIASGVRSTFLDTSASVEPTVTRGVVSAIKEAKGDKRKLIQTDASITNGNSGGPAIDSEGKVIGIATYGLVNESTGGNYNFLRDIDDMKELLGKNGIKVETGETYENWKLGLESYWLGYYRYSRDDFGKVINAYPEHVSAKKYFDDSGGKVGSIEDKTPKFTKTQRRLYINIAMGMMIISVLGIILMVIWGVLKKKNGSGFNQVSFQATKQVPIPSAVPTSLGG